ncbi:Tyrosine-protein kinase YwqD [Tsuneonella dongtanensis]|uniref:non-specific protein-tyrosine kinase n=1 Tax=Tsuneonella dongtanensis TaxID=692370 RepID=A0A1B2ABG6_9SPHN|nr:polysaccharide biosynthesis tyrosine autokinase [Tsuneonella dongtanensis]ANY19428.1 Tyrosine-protein kinase YwqD [Tsuneonella dongtanensis]
MDPIENKAPGNSWAERYLPGSDGGGEYQGTQISLQTVRGILWRQRYILVGVTALAVLAGFLMTIMQVPTFQATATVRADPEEADIFEGSSLAPDININRFGDYLSTLAMVIQSRSLAETVVDALDLADNPDVVGDIATVRPDGMSDAKWKERRRAVAVNVVHGGVQAEVPGSERVIAISYQSEDPQLAARIANGFAEAFLTDDLRRSIQKNEYAQAYLEKEILETRNRLETAERQALGYARANNIVGEAMLAPPVTGTATEQGAAPQTVAASSLASINSTYSAARANRINAEQRWRAAAAASPSELREVQASPVVQSIVARRATAQSELAEQRVRYGPSHPVVQELEAELATLDRQLARESSAIKEALRKEYLVAARQEEALGRELSNVSSKVLDEQERRVSFNALNGEVTGLRTQLQSLLDRYNQISASANVRPNTITLLDKATVPNRPVSPVLAKNLLIALILGAGLAVLLAALRETFDDRLRSAEDVERKLGVPLLGMTPLVEAEDLADPKGALAEAHASIRAAVGFTLPRRDHNILMVSSSQEQEGKSTTAISLATKFAALGQKVLLIDGDLRRPSLASALGYKRTDRGFAEVLAGQVRLQDALLPQTNPNLDVLPVGAIPPNPVEVVSSPRLDEFVAEQRKHYALIVIDSAPVIGLADAPLLARVCDGVIFVVESNRAHFGQAKAALRRLRESGTNVLGVVLTKFRALEAGESYGYGYKYYAYGDKQAA